jgi:hypothetical protein
MEFGLLEIGTVKLGKNDKTRKVALQLFEGKGHRFSFVRAACKMD